MYDCGIKATGSTPILAHASHSSARVTPRDSGKRVRQCNLEYSAALYVHARLAAMAVKIGTRGDGYADGLAKLRKGKPIQ